MSTRPSHLLRRTLPSASLVPCFLLVIGVQVANAMQPDANKEPVARTAARTTFRGYHGPSKSDDPASTATAAGIMMPRGVGITTVIAEGIGASEEAALRDAFRAAVRQTLGSIIRSKTVVQNDTAVVDRIVTFSNGFVDDYRILATWSEAEFIHRKISADVRTRELSMQLRAEQATPSHDARGLWPEVVTRIERRKNAVELYRSIMENFPWGCLSVGTIGKPRVVELLDESAHVSPTTRIKIDSEAFGAIVSQLASALEVLAKESGVIESKIGKPSNLSRAQLEANFRSRFFNDDTPMPLARRKVTFSSVSTFTAGRDTISASINALPDKSGILFLLGNGRRWNWYFVKESIELPRSRRSVAMLFVDQNGKTVVKRTVGLGPVAPGISINDTAIDGKRFTTVFVAPYFLDHSGTGMLVSSLAGCSSVTIDGEIALTVDDFREIAEASSLLE